MALSLIYLMFLPDIGYTFVDAAEVGGRRVVTRGRENAYTPIQLHSLQYLRVSSHFGVSTSAG